MKRTASLVLNECRSRCTDLIHIKDPTKTIKIHATSNQIKIERGVRQVAKTSLHFADDIVLINDNLEK